jgi:antitoxin component of MazEF toxin-antitoxin module
MQNIEIRKWGNSAAIRLNKGLLQQVSCEIGSTVEAIVKDGGVFLKPVTTPNYTLGELLETCSKKNTCLDSEDKVWLSSNPVGKEV